MHFVIKFLGFYLGFWNDSIETKKVVLFWGHTMGHVVEEGAFYRSDDCCSSRDVGKGLAALSWLDATVNAQGGVAPDA